MDERISENIKKENTARNKMFAVESVHFLITILLFYFTFLLFRYQKLSSVTSRGFRYNYFVTIGYAFCLVFFNRTYNSYLFGYSRVRSLVFSMWLSQFFSAAIIYFAVCIGWNHFHSPMLFVLLVTVVYIPLDVIWAYFGNKYYYKTHPPKKTILIYRNEQDRRRLGYMTGKPTERLYHVEKEIQFDGSFSEIRDELEGYEAVFAAGINSRCRNGILKHCEENNVYGFFLPHVGDMIMQGAEHIHVYDSPVLMVKRKVVNPEYRAIKRFFDFVLSLLGLIILSPIFIITALAIKLYDRGPVFYKQVRLTKDGKEFEIIKFRSMRVDAENDGVARLSSGENDPRITPVGKIVRKCRLDELPQLINILKGDMSIVGPRPERPEIAEKYYKNIPDFKLRLQVKAGLTGYAQVYGKYNTDPYEKLEFDLLYINNMSIFTDLQLMFATFSILFAPESTEGVEEGQVTALDYEDSAES